jgi:hypothetical protein
MFASKLTITVAIFGVERRYVPTLQSLTIRPYSGRLYNCAELIRCLHSTVSKVLRQKEKYLSHEDGSRSPIKRIKGRTPDVDKTLAKWALKQVGHVADLESFSEPVVHGADTILAGTTRLHAHR